MDSNRPVSGKRMVFDFNTQGENRSSLLWLSIRTSVYAVLASRFQVIDLGRRPVT